MQTPRMRVLPGWLATAVLSTLSLGGSLAGVACGGASKDGTNDGKAEAKVAEVEAKADDAGAVGEASAAEGAPGTTGDPEPAEPVEPEGVEAGEPADAGEPAGADGSAVEEAGGDEAGAVEAAPDPKVLLKEVSNRRTKDARAQLAVTEAEAAGAEPADVAKALNARGEALHATPERAAPFFELALEKDPKYPVPAFNLAKQAAMIGELDEAKKWLTIVHERKGTKLLKQVDFDPMWEILKDDPEVRALIK